MLKLWKSDHMHGTLQALRNLPNLRVVRLENNYLMGELPEEIMKLPQGEV